jgi:hypothetical protein
MRGFQEIKGQNTRLVYDPERGTFFVKFEPKLPFVPAPKVETKHNGNGEQPTRMRKW